MSRFANLIVRIPPILIGWALAVARLHAQESDAHAGALRGRRGLLLSVQEGCGNQQGEQRGGRWKMENGK